jgi:hypothetical protein
MYFILVQQELQVSIKLLLLLTFSPFSGSEKSSNDQQKTKHHDESKNVNLYCDSCVALQSGRGERAQWTEGRFASYAYILVRVGLLDIGIYPKQDSPKIL